MTDLVKDQKQESRGVYWCERKIEGIVFDVDGTLTNSIEAYYDVFREVTASIGIDVRKEDLLESMAEGSLIWDRAIPTYIPDRNEKIKQCMNAIPQVYQEVFQRVLPFAGLESVLKRLEEQGIGLGVLTSSWAAAVSPLYNHSLARYFRVIMTREDGFPLKPAPDGILECLSRMKIRPKCAISVGDSPLDIRAGKAAGTLTVGVLSGIGSHAQIEAESPTAIIDEVTQLLSLMSLK